MSEQPIEHTDDFNIVSEEPFDYNAAIRNTAEQEMQIVEQEQATPQEVHEQAAHADEEVKPIEQEECQIEVEQQAQEQEVPQEQEKQVDEAVNEDAPQAEQDDNKIEEEEVDEEQEEDDDEDEADQNEQQSAPIIDQRIYDDQNDLDLSQEKIIELIMQQLSSQGMEFASEKKPTPSTAAVLYEQAQLQNREAAEQNAGGQKIKDEEYDVPEEDDDEEDEGRAARVTARNQMSQQQGWQRQQQQQLRGGLSEEEQAFVYEAMLESQVKDYRLKQQHAYVQLESEIKNIQQYILNPSLTVEQRAFAEQKLHAQILQIKSLQRLIQEQEADPSLVVDIIKQRHAAQQQDQSYADDDQNAFHRFASAPQQSQQQNGQYQNHPLVNFFNSYSLFINDTSNIQLDQDQVLSKLIDNATKCKPPTNSDERVNYLWSYLTDLNKKQIEDFETQLRGLPEQNIYDCIHTIEKLHIKLLVEYNIEVSRGKTLDIIKQ